jgi:hypothetical protein
MEGMFQVHTTMTGTSAAHDNEECDVPVKIMPRKHTIF